MFEIIGIPLWLLIVLAVLSAMAIYHFLAAPVSRWELRRRSRSVVRKVNPSLQLKLSPFTLTRRRVLADRLANDPIVVAAMEVAADENDVPIEKLRKDVGKIAYEIVPAFSPYFYFRFGHRIARGFLRFLYHVRLGHIDDPALAAIDPNARVVFVMNHRTNFDYLLVTYLTAHRTMWSIGVGEWALVWPIQPLLRAAGIYFLRRESGNPLYRTLVQRYIQMALEAHVPQAIFLEGALSRSGGLQKPRLGLLSYLTKTYDPHTDDDIVFVPIGTNYDRVAEERTMVIRGDESFVNRGSWFVLRAAFRFVGYLIWQAMRGKRRIFGNACANFGTPVSFAAWLRGHWVDWSSLDREGKYQLLTRFGDDLMGDIEGLIPVLPVAVVCSICGEDEGSGITEDALRAEFEARIDRVQKAGGHALLPEGDVKKAFEEARRMLTGRRILQLGADGLLRPNPKDLELIAYYANSVAHFAAAAPKRSRQPG